MKLNNYSQLCVPLALLLQAGSVMGDCRGHWDINLLPDTPKRTLNDCRYADLAGPVGFVWAWKPKNGDSDVSISVIAKGKTEYKTFVGGHHEQHKKKADGRNLSLVGNFGTMGRQGVSDYRVQIHCEEEKEKCEGSFTFRVIDCGCPRGTYKVKECTFDTIRGGSDAICAVPKRSHSTVEEPELVTLVPTEDETLLPRIYGNDESNGGNSRNLRRRGN